VVDFDERPQHIKALSSSALESLPVFARHSIVESCEGDVFRRCWFDRVEFQKQMVTKTSVVEKLLEVASGVMIN
jgi:hypothetical protein